MAFLGDLDPHQPSDQNHHEELAEDGFRLAERGCSTGLGSDVAIAQRR